MGRFNIYITGVLEGLTRADHLAAKREGDKEEREENLPELKSNWSFQFKAFNYKINTNFYKSTTGQTLARFLNFKENFLKAFYPDRKKVSFQQREGRGTSFYSIAFKSQMAKHS